MTISYSLIVAMDANRGIGFAGDLPWRLSADLKYFKKITTQTTSPDKKNAVIMGRKTWESLPGAYRPLPDRVNFILTRNLNFKPKEEASVIHDIKDLEQALTKQPYIEKAFIIGGAEIFELALKLPNIERIYLTAIDHTFPCDTFFPSFEAFFDLIESSSPAKEGDLTFTFKLYQRKNLP